MMGERQWWEHVSGLGPRHGSFKQQSHPFLQDNTRKSAYCVPGTEHIGSIFLFTPDMDLEYLPDVN